MRESSGKGGSTRLWIFVDAKCHARVAPSKVLEVTSDEDLEQLDAATAAEEKK